MPSLIKVRQVKIKWLSEEGDTRGHWPEEETLISLSINLGSIPTYVHTQTHHKRLWAYTPDLFL